MSENPVQQKIEALVTEIIGDDDQVFLVNVEVSAGNNIGVFLDADNGLTIEKCSKINRALYNKLEELELFPENNFSLEVSSPGVDEPLKLERQYKKNIGRTVQVTTTDDTINVGKLTGVTTEGVIVEKTEGKGKKAIIANTTILFNQIKHIKVLVTF